MPAYDASYFAPPAPLARITLRNPQSGLTLSDVPMLIDTGADATLVPQASVEMVGVIASPGAEFEVVAFDGTTSFMQVASLDVLFLKKTFKGRFLLINQEVGILGRDILNHLKLLFDGPSLNWDEQKQ